jgi:hypothetical protein
LISLFKAEQGRTVEMESTTLQQALEKSLLSSIKRLFLVGRAARVEGHTFECLTLQGTHSPRMSGKMVQMEEPPLLEVASQAEAIREGKEALVVEHHALSVIGTVWK